jgi:hypothetical protein
VGTFWTDFQAGFPHEWGFSLPLATKKLWPASAAEVAETRISV